MKKLTLTTAALFLALFQNDLFAEECEHEIDAYKQQVYKIGDFENVPQEKTKDKFEQSLQESIYWSTKTSPETKTSSYLKSQAAKLKKLLAVSESDLKKSTGLQEQQKAMVQLLSQKAQLCLVKTALQQDKSNFVADNSDAKVKKGNGAEEGSTNNIFQHAFSAYENNSYEDAAALFKDGLNKNGNDANAWLYLSLSQQIMGQQEEAIKSAEHAKKLGLAAEKLVLLKNINDIYPKRELPKELLIDLDKIIAEKLEKNPAYATPSVKNSISSFTSYREYYLNKIPAGLGFIRSNLFNGSSFPQIPKAVQNLNYFDKLEPNYYSIYGLGGLVLIGSYSLNTVKPRIYDILKNLHLEGKIFPLVEGNKFILTTTTVRPGINFSSVLIQYCTIGKEVSYTIDQEFINSAGDKIELKSNLPLGLQPSVEISCLINDAKTPKLIYYIKPWGMFFDPLQF